MGYYADGNGSVTFLNLSKDRLKQIRARLEEEYEVYDVSPGDSTAETVVSFCTGEKYHDDLVREILRDVSGLGDIKDGEIEYVGEDNSLWRFIWVKDFGWLEQNGWVEYPPVEDDILAARLTGRSSF